MGEKEVGARRGRGAIVVIVGARMLFIFSWQACEGTTRGRGATVVGDVSSLPVLVNLLHCERNQVDAGTGTATVAQPKQEHG